LRIPLDVVSDLIHEGLAFLVGVIIFSLKYSTKVNPTDGVLTQVFWSKQVGDFYSQTHAA